MLRFLLTHSTLDSISAARLEPDGIECESKPDARVET